MEEFTNNYVLVPVVEDFTHAFLPHYEELHVEMDLPIDREGEGGDVQPDKSNA